MQNIKETPSDLWDICDHSSQHIHKRNLVVEDFAEPICPFNPFAMISWKTIFQSTKNPWSIFNWASYKSDAWHQWKELRFGAQEFGKDKSTRQKMVKVEYAEGDAGPNTYLGSLVPRWKMHTKQHPTKIDEYAIQRYCLHKENISLTFQEVELITKWAHLP